MIKKGYKITAIVLALLIGLYPAIYFIIDRKFGLLNTKPEELLGSLIWNIFFYLHIIFGGISLLIGWILFIKKIRLTKISLHKTLGKIYISSALISSISSLYIGLYATGGIIASIGFICLGIAWFYTTLRAYVHIRKKQIIKHEQLMIISYALCFAAVTLRIWLPILVGILGDFNSAYIITAWLCWVPNLIGALLIINHKKTIINTIS